MNTWLHTQLDLPLKTTIDLENMGYYAGLEISAILQDHEINGMTMHFQVHDPYHNALVAQFSIPCVPERRPNL